MYTAVLFDGEFFLKRYHYIRGSQPPDRAAADLHWIAREHARKDNLELYRIFFYDCLPMTHKIHNPLTRELIDFSKSPSTLWRKSFHDELKTRRKVALRLGYLNERSGQWLLGGDPLKNLLAGKITIDQLEDKDIKYDVTQKGVDIRIGLDIASMTFKKQIRQVVLVAGDSDFVPAAKLARREGIDFVLDPMWAKIRNDLLEHIDGLRTVIRRGDESPQSGNWNDNNRGNTNTNHNPNGNNDNQKNHAAWNEHPRPRAWVENNYPQWPNHNNQRHDNAEDETESEMVEDRD